MKTAFLSILILLSASGSLSAQGFKIGGHGAGSAGGDINVPSAGYGAHVIGELNRFLGIELSLTQFTDEGNYENGELFSTSIGASGRLSCPLASSGSVFIAGGASYGMFDFDSEPTEVIAMANNRSEQDHAEAYDMTVNEFRALSASYEVVADIDLDDQLSWHMSAGFEWELGDNLELLLDYRYTFTRLKGDIWMENINERQEIEFKQDYDFGLLRIGVNILL